MAEFQLCYVTRQLTAAKIKNALRNLPSVLETLYDEQLDRIKAKGPERWILVVNAISWICYAARPLSEAELLEALAIEEWQTRHNGNDCIEIEILLKLCNGLITLQTPGRTLHFSHYTVQRYVLARAGLFRPQIHLAKICLTYLLFDERTIETPDMVDHCCQNHPFCKGDAQPAAKPAPEEIPPVVSLQS